MKEQDIRDIWKSGDQQRSPGYSQEAIDAILKQGPHNIIQRFVKTLKIELVINTLSLLLVTFMLLFKGNWAIAIGTTVFNGLAFIYYRNLLGKLTIEFADANVIEYLGDVQGVIKKFIAHYKIFIMILVLPAYYLGLKLGQRILDTTEDIQMGMTFHLANAACIGAVIGLSFVALQLMYGRKSQKIKEMIDSLSEEE